MRKPVIGIAGSMGKMPGSFVERNFANHVYVKGVVSGGGVPIILPLLDDKELLTSALELCDGFLIPGGIDVCPDFYGENPHEKLGETDRRLDEFDFFIIEYAFDKHKPLLGICRGEQIMNIALGGSLYQDISEYTGCAGAALSHTQTEGRSVTTHDVIIEPDTWLYRVLDFNCGRDRNAALTRNNEQEKISVNSLHHQFIKTPGRDIIISARATDGVIEAFESRELINNSAPLIMAVQWHPEELLETVPAMKNLFCDLVARAKICKENFGAKICLTRCGGALDGRSDDGK